MQTLHFTSRMNGWVNTVYVKTDLSKIKETLLHVENRNVIRVEFDVFGVDRGLADLNLSTGMMTLDHEITIMPYEDNGKVKVIKEIKVEKFTLTQIKGYVSERINNN